MFKVFFTIVLLLAENFTFAYGLSAQRPTNESWLVSKQKFQFEESLKFKIEKNSDSALDSKVDYDKVDLNQIPEFQKNSDEILQIFQDIRNIRFLDDPDKAHFPRRISWLYPMDGCFARAEWVAHLLKKTDPTVQFSRVFIFGDLEVKTKNSSTGSVSWWYHVAVMIKHQGKAYVIDPSLEVTRPLELAEWVGLQVSNPSTDAELAICSSGSYGPSSDCAASENNMLSDEDAAEEISGYLSAERRNLKKLGRDPQVELGGNPPW